MVLAPSSWQSSLFLVFLLLVSACCLPACAATSAADEASSSSPKYGGGGDLDYDSSVLRFALVITRHGDRTPTHTFPNTKSTWPEGLGQLTWLGMEQQYELGQMFRRRYVEERKLVGSEYRGQEVYVRSTSKERTLMSAQSFMHGFYPPKHGLRRLPGGLQPVPVHAFAKHQDIVLYAYKNCPRLKTLQQQVKQGKEWRAMEEKTAELRANLSQIMGAEIKLGQMSTVTTLLKQEITHNKSTADGFEMELLTAAKPIAAWELRQKYATREMGILGSGELFKEILHLMEPHMVGTEASTDEPRFVLFSAHDGTLLAIFTALGLHDFEIPPFGAHLVFELYTGHEATNRNSYVKVSYNGEAFVLPGCQASGICPMDTFGLLLRQSSSPSWHQACQAAICSVATVEAAEEQAPKSIATNGPTKNHDQDKPWAIGHSDLAMLATGLAVGLTIIPLCNSFFPKPKGKVQTPT